MIPLPVWNAPVYCGSTGKERSMVTPDGPACDQCQRPLPGGYGYISFFFCHTICCSKECLEAAETERRQAIRAEEYSLNKHGHRHWKVVDGNGELVCITLYKKGAAEVIRRLNRRNLPRFRPHTGTFAHKTRSAPDIPLDAVASAGNKIRTQAA